MKYLKILLVVTIAGSTLGCNKFLDVNQDPNNPLEVEPRIMLPPLLLNLTYNLSGGLPAIYINHFMQNIALNQPVPNIGTFLMVNPDVNGTWSNGYVTLMKNLRILNSKAEAGGLWRYAGISKISLAYTLGSLTDMFGDMPYSDAFQGSVKFTPDYDNQASIYAEVQKLLDDGIANLNENHPATPGGADLIYGGNIDNWKKLAYTLKARYAMHLTKAPGTTAAAQADLALAALNNGFTSNGDDFDYKYPGGANTENPWTIHFRPLSTIVLSAAAVDTLVERDDPRLPIMIKQGATGMYLGRPIGQNTLGVLPNYSIPGDIYAGADATHSMVTYAEALFLKAEATLIKSGAAAAQPFYQEAIKAHMTRIGVDIADQNEYLSRRGSLTDPGTIPLARIMEEKKIANFLNIENWVDWRRTGYPVMTPPPNALSAIPRRFLYPQSELNSNPQPLHTATLTDRVWWDAP